MSSVQIENRYKIKRRGLFELGAQCMVEDVIDSQTGKTMIRKTFLDPDVFDNESTILDSLDHPGIIKIIDRGQNYLIFERYPGDLFMNIDKLTPDLVKKYFSQLVDILSHIHSKDIVHSDIKLENILLTTEDNVILIDFDLAYRMTPGILTENRKGTKFYLAPEILAREAHDGFCTDIWSLGVLLFEMMYLVSPNTSRKGFPFGDPLIKAVIEKRLDIPSVSPALKDLLERMLEINWLKRIKIDDISKHPWLLE